ncbi:hypothetical protein ABT033_21080 [Streptomyces pharetrae]|uniref:hypothetical protein n=1 Tax=Streptomyces pharetrae TaxID=291370 RepID=UPI00334CB1E8
MDGPEIAAPDHRLAGRLFHGLSERAAREERMVRPLTSRLPPGGEQPVRDHHGDGRTAPARPHPHAPDRPPALSGPPTAAYDRLGDRLQRRLTT